MEMQQSSGFIVWFTGMKRAGKSTLAARVVERFALAGRAAQLLDEDGEAGLLLAGLGPSKEDHAVRVKRLGFVARAVARAGGVAVCAALSPYRDAREALRRDARRFVEIFVDSAMETLIARDGKEGLYKRALAGELTQVAGVDVPYEPPSHAEAVIRTDLEPVDDSVRRVLQALVDQKYVGPAEFGRLTGGERPRRRPSAARASRSPARRAGAAPGRRGASRSAGKKSAARTTRAARRRG